MYVHVQVHVCPKMFTLNQLNKLVTNIKHTTGLQTTLNGKDSIYV